VSDPTDPVEAWLGADVELMPPPPGQFARVRRRARRRRAARALSATAGAAAVVAAAVIVPQVVSGLPGHGNPANVGGTSSPPHTRAPRHHTASPSPRRSPATRPAKVPPGASLASPGAQAAAAGFRPTSVTFIGGYTGAVLGRPGTGCSPAACTAVAATHDYGTGWTAIGAPAAGAPDGSSGVSQIRFLNQDYGWAYGPALYATADGGARWHQVTGLPGRVIDLSTVNGAALAVVATCSGSGAAYASGCTSFALYRTTAGTGRWHRVAGAAGAGAAAPGGLQLAGSGPSYLLAGGLLFSGQVTGGAWHRVAVAAGGPPCLGGANGHGPELIAPDGGLLYLACDATGRAGSLALYSSGDGGKDWQRDGAIPARGTARSLAAIPGGAVLLATTSGIYYSPDATNWRPAGLSGTAPPGGFSFVGMTLIAQGVAVPARSSLGEIYITQDGGSSWSPERIG